jgi:pSer/pThr/pTyr-binding forkhead associated (FHA) protein
MTKLTLRHNGLTLKEYELAKERITIGRRSDNDIQLDDPTVSGIHAVLTLKPDAYFEGAFEVAIIDFNSTNGLHVNGEKVQQKRLCVGDIIRIGQHELLFDEPADNPFEQTAIFLDNEE